MFEPYVVHVLESSGKISDTIRFDDTSETRILPDDSIRTIKIKILYELHKNLHIRASYEELYLYSFVSEETSTLKLFDALKTATGEDDNPQIPLSTVAQILAGHPKSERILKKLGSGSNATISYGKLESVLSEKNIEMFVRTPLGMQFARGQRDVTFEADPFEVKTLLEHDDLVSLENTLLLNYGAIADRAIYVCLADRVFDNAAAGSVEYLSRYYYPGLYGTSIKTQEDLVNRRPKLAKTTNDLLTTSRLQHYKSIQTFYDIANDQSTPVSYKKRGIMSATLRLKNATSRSVNLEMLFKSMHSRRETPYIKFNPANRRENLYRFYYERTTRSGKKIPYLSRAKIMRMMKETGKAQQISMYLEDVVLKEHETVSNCYLHFESNGDIQLQFVFSKPMVEKTIDELINRSVAPLLKRIGQDLRQTGYHIPTPHIDGTFQHSKIVDMEYVAIADAERKSTWESVPCLYSICTHDSEQTRLKRVENFQEMDAARILILELYGRIQYGDYAPQDIVEELVAKRLAESEDAAKILVSEVLSTLHEIDGDIIERPGFPMTMKIDNEEHTVEIRVGGLTSPAYVDTVSAYVDAILKTTQLYKESNPLLKQLNRLCKKARKFEEVVVENPIALSPLRFTSVGPLQFTATENLLAQFESDDEDDNIAPALVPEEEEEDIGNLLDRLHENARNINPIVFDDDDDERPSKKQEQVAKPGPIVFDEEEEVEEEVEKEVEKEVPAKTSIFDTIGSMLSSKPAESLKDTQPRIMQFHSKAELISATNEYKQYLDVGMPDDAMRVLSNFSNHSVEYKGRVFHTVEHAFQSQKYEISGHPEVVRNFTVEGRGWTAAEAKKQGSPKTMESLGVKLDVNKWNELSGPIMEALIQSKVDRHEEIRKILEVVKRENIQLAHFSKSDMNWGCHLNPDGKSIKIGENLLGEIYMKLADKQPESKQPESKQSEDKQSEDKQPEDKQPGPIIFDNDEEEEIEYGGADDEDDKEEEEEDEARLVPDGMALKPVNPFLKKLRKRDPVLFMRKSSGKYKAFSVSCQPTSRHPVILNQEEFDKLDPASYKHSIKYGSDPKNPHHFICPRFWCFLTNSAISEEDVKAGKCGEVIPKGADKIPKGAYVYELNDRAQYPGFIEDAREDGKCLPCCFKSWDGKTQREARARCEAQMNTTEEGQESEDKKPTKRKQIAQKTAQYIYNLDTYPVPTQRWGFLPIPVQMFLNMDYRPAIDPNNPAILKPEQRVLLRYGVEQPPKQSFMGNFADIYSRRQGLDKIPAVDEFRRSLSEAITLDIFVKAHNGSLLSAFSKPDTKKKPDRKKYANTEFAIGLDLNDRGQKRYLDDAIIAYENFIAYLNDRDGKIDHQYLWDFVCGDNARIIPGGLNLIILEIQANDMLDRVELLCPTNLYSSHQYDAEKDTVILLKHDEYYEPVYQYASTSTGQPIVAPFFINGSLSASLQRILKNVELSMQKYCPALPSMPTVYQGFSNPVPLKRILASLIKAGLTIEAQVCNYQGKTIGLIVVEKDQKKKRTGIYVPCAPSARVKDITVKYMDDLSILKDYETTTEALMRISKAAKLPCRPLWKIKEDGLVVGFLTETNQFVPIRPNEDIIMDGLHAYEGVDAFVADKIVATSRKADKKREKLTKYITLESQFYHAFRTRVRALLSQFSNRSIRASLKKTAEDPVLLYSQKVERVETILKTLIDGQVIFVDIADDVLLDMAAVNECDDAADESPSCIIKENGVAQLAIPKRHLLSNHDNEKVYVGRLSDEFVRNDRVRSFMYDTAGKLNAQTVDYNIQSDEFILVQSALTPEYFTELDSAGEQQTKYATQTNYELANPSITKFYPNEKIPLSEQYKEPADASDLGDCLAKVGPVIGNPKTLWPRIFSSSAREWTYRDTANCTFQPIIRIVEEHLGAKWDENEVRRKLVAAYMALFERRPEFIVKVGGVMRKQGKSRMFANKNMTPDEFVDIIVSDSYYLSDMDIWMLASHYGLPIILFNTNGLKGFFAKLDVQWLRLSGPMAKSVRYHFLRSTVGSFANKIYEYGLIIPAVTLESTREFATMVLENAYTVDEALSKIIFVANK